MKLDADKIAAFKARAHEMIDEAPAADSLVIMRYQVGGTIALGAQGSDLYRLPVMARALLEQALKLLQQHDGDPDVMTIMQACVMALPCAADIEEELPEGATAH